MAILHEQGAQQSFYLGSRHMFGQNLTRADTLLTNADASQQHASIHWNGTHWEIVDHSRHGTLIDGQPIPSNIKIALAAGQIIRFAPGAAQSFKVINLDAPCPMLLPVGHPGDDRPAIALRTLHYLPDDDTRKASVHLAINGQWLWEDANGSTALHDGDRMHVAGRCWQFFHKPGVDAGTDVNAAAKPPAPDLHFDFLVSQNEEHIQLSINARDETLDLGERTHHYCLLTLARRRFADARQGFDVLSQGWIGTSELADMLKVEEKHLSMMLHRARSQIVKQCKAAALAPDFIERRRGELRFGSFGFQIQRGCELEAVFDPGQAHQSPAAPARFAAGAKR